MAEFIDSQSKLRELQHQVRLNATDTTSYLADLQKWQNEMQQKEMQLNSSKACSNSNPIRGSNNPLNADSRKRCSGSCEKAKAKRLAKKNSNTAKINSYDYREWDKFDVDKACDDIDYETAPGSEDDERCGSECDCGEMKDSSADIELAAKKKRAEFEKSLGNQCFEKGNFVEAIKYYSNAIGYDSTTAIYFSNRAMAYLKVNKFKSAEEDCNQALKLDPSLVKAYHRRATARIALKDVVGAKADLKKVLHSEPKNKEVLEKLRAIEKWESSQKTTIAPDKVTPSKGTNDADIPPLEDMSGSGKIHKDAALIAVSSTKSSEKKFGRQNPVEPLDKPLLPGAPEFRKVPVRTVLLSDTPDSVTAQQSRTERVDLSALKLNDPKECRQSPEVVQKPVVGGQPSTSEKAGEVRTETLQHAEVRRFAPPRSFRELHDACIAFVASKTGVVDYFKDLSPSRYKELIGPNLEKEIFQAVISGVLQLFSSGDTNLAIEHLSALGSVERVGFFVYLISPEEKKALTEYLRLAPKQHVEATKVLSEKFRL